MGREAEHEINAVHNKSKHSKAHSVRAAKRNVCFMSKTYLFMEYIYYNIFLCLLCE